MTRPQELVTSTIEFSRKLVSGALPQKLVLYAVDSDHLILVPRESEELEKKALAKSLVEVAVQPDSYVLKLPRNVFEFYRLDENDYTVMVPEKDPETIIVTI